MLQHTYYSQNYAGIIIMAGPNNEVMERCQIDGMSPFRGPMVYLVRL